MGEGREVLPKVLQCKGDAEQEGSEWSGASEHRAGEDEADEGGETLLSEAGDILDDKAGICGHQDKALDGRVQANPEAELHVVQAIASGRQREAKTSSPGSWLCSAPQTHPGGLICSSCGTDTPLGTTRGLGPWAGPGWGCLVCVTAPAQVSFCSAWNIEGFVPANIKARARAMIDCMNRQAIG